MNEQDKAAFEAAIGLIPEYEITSSDLQEVFEAALKHRDAQAGAINEQLLKSAKHALDLWSKPNRAPETITKANEIVDEIADAAKQLKAAIAAAEARNAPYKTELPPPAYAGVIMWVGDHKITKILDEQQIRFELFLGQSIAKAAQICINDLTMTMNLQEFDADKEKS